MTPTTFEVDEAKAKADQLAQQLDTADTAGERASIESELRDARDQVQALSDAQVSAGATSTNAKRADDRSDPGEALQETQQGGVEADPEQPQAESTVPAAEAHTSHHSEGREIDKANELHESLQTTDPMPETTAAIERWEQQGANDVSQVRELRDGESITGTVEGTCTVNGQEYNVLLVEGENGSTERVRVPADPEHELGDTVAAERDGEQIDVRQDYGHGL